MIKKKFGFIQGRMTKSKSKNILQFFPQKNWEKEISEANSYGFKFIEYIAERNMNYKNPVWSKTGIDKMNYLTNKYNLENYSFCEDFFINHDIRKYKNLDNYINKLFKNLNKLKIKIYVLALFEKSDLNELNYLSFINILKKLSKKLKKYRIKLALETNLAQEYLSFLFKKLSDKNINLVYDTGNRLKKNINQYNEIVQFKDKIVHVHIKDKNFNGKNVVLGKGNVNFKSIFKSLKKINYKGCFVFETNRGSNAVKTMINNLKIIKKISKSLRYEI
jgi:L-ribulose-5-phosphate 3-epimerase